MDPLVHPSYMHPEGSPACYGAIVRLQHKHLFGTLQLCYGWRVGLAPYSTEVEHVHENRYRGAQHVTLPYLKLPALYY